MMTNNLLVCSLLVGLLSLGAAGGVQAQSATIGDAPATAADRAADSTAV
mgnify:FL=1